MRPDFIAGPPAARLFETATNLNLFILMRNALNALHREVQNADLLRIVKDARVLVGGY